MLEQRQVSCRPRWAYPTLKATGFTPVEQYMAAGLIFSILPVLFYLSMQRYIISGLTAGAVKG